GAGRAHAGEGVPAGHEHLFHGAGVEIGAAQLYRADARAVLDGQVLDDLAGQRHGQPFGPRLPYFGLSQSSPSFRGVVAGQGDAEAAQAALSEQPGRTFQDEKARAAQRARFIGAPGPLDHAASPPVATTAAIASMSASVTYAARPRTGSGEVSSRT